MHILLTNQHIQIYYLNLCDSNKVALIYKSLFIEVVKLMHLHYQYAVSYVLNLEGEGDIEQQNEVNNQPPEEVNNQPPEEGNNQPPEEGNNQQPEENKNQQQNQGENEQQELEEGVDMEAQAMRAEYCQLCIF